MISNLFQKNLLSLIYLFAYSYMHIFFLVEYYPGWGFTLSETSIDLRFSFLFFGIILITNLLPKNIKKFSDFFCWFIFSILFIPTFLTILLSNNALDAAVINASLLLCSFLFILYTPNIIKKRIVLLINIKDTLSFLLIPSVILLAFFFIIFRDLLGFAGIEDVYLQRSSVDLISRVGTLGSYLLLWMGYAIAPVLLAYGLIENKKIFIFFGVLLFIFIYSLVAARYVFISIGLIFLFKILIDRFSLIQKPYILMLIPLGAVSLSLFLAYISTLYYQDNENILFFISGILAMRGLGIQAIFFETYLSFFENNPFTYFSHISIFSSFFEYPYERPLGIEIGDYMVPGLFNANANFWATDGIASLGRPGVLVIGFIVGVILYFIDSLTRVCKIKFLILSSTSFCLAAMNVSFFTSLLSGGGILIFLINNIFFKNSSYDTKKQSS